MNYELVTAMAVIMAFLFIVIATVKLPGLRRKFVVPQGYAGLLYHQGRFVSVLGIGRHIRWGRNFTVGFYDTRRASLVVPAQEVLSADNVSLKFSLHVGYQMTDPVKAAHESQNWQTEIYNSAQLALRGIVGGMAVEPLLTQRKELGAQLLALVQPPAAKIGINVLAVEVKDVSFPADLKSAFAEVLKAKHEGQAALERARGESAALRNLANAARVMEGNPALMNLRLMQSLTAARNAGNTLVLGMPVGFVPLPTAKSTPSSEAKENGGEEA